MKNKLLSRLGMAFGSLALIALCSTIIVTGTFALFTDTVTINTHLNAGNLQITLTRTAHSYSVLDEDGLLSTTSVANERVDAKDLTNAFDLPNGAIIVPNSKLEAKFEIANNDTVAFDYTVSIIARDSEGNALQQPNALLSQLSVKVTDSQGSSSLQSGATTLEVQGRSTLKAKRGSDVDKEQITIEIEFLDADNNNDAMSQNLFFDIVINAAQKIND